MDKREKKNKILFLYYFIKLDFSISFYSRGNFFQSSSFTKTKTYEIFMPLQTSYRTIAYIFTRYYS